MDAARPARRRRLALRRLRFGPRPGLPPVAAAGRVEASRRLHVSAALLALGTAIWTWQGRTGSVEVALLWAVAIPGSLLVGWSVWRTPTVALRLPPLLLWAAALRGLGVLGTPILEDDYYRYLWDGYRLVEAGNPYGVAPSAFFGDPQVPPAMQPVLNGINHPDVPTIYGPIQQALFGLSHRVAPGELWPLQTLLSVIDLGLLVLLWQLGARHGAWLYGLCPLVIKEVAFTAHPDGAMAALLVVALWCRLRLTHHALEAAGGLATALPTTVASAWGPAMGVAIGLAVACKVVALAAVPLMLWGLPRRVALAAAFAAALFLAAAYAPFLATAGSTGLDGAGLVVFAERWVFNPALFGIASGLLADLSARIAMLLVFAGLVLLLLWRQHRLTLEPPRLDLLFGALLLCAPAINPWYALWVLPFAALHPSRTAWVAAATLPFAYAYDPETFVVPAWAIAAQFGSMLLALRLDWRRPLAMPGTTAGV